MFCCEAAEPRASPKLARSDPLNYLKAVLAYAMDRDDSPLPAHRVRANPAEELNEITATWEAWKPDFQI
jgi:hypothetical protein